MSQIKTTAMAGDVAVSRHVTAGGNADIRGNACVKKNLIVEGWLDARNLRGVSRGLYRTPTELEESQPDPHNGWWATVGTGIPAELYIAYGGKWNRTGKMVEPPVVAFEDYAEQSKRLEDLEGIVDDMTPTGFSFTGLDSSTGPIINLTFKGRNAVYTRMPMARTTQSGVLFYGDYIRFNKATETVAEIQTHISEIDSQINDIEESLDAWATTINDIEGNIKLLTEVIKEEHRNREAADIGLSNRISTLENAPAPDTLSAWQRNYLEEMERKEREGKLSVSFSMSPSGNEYDGVSRAYSLLTTVRFDGVAVDFEKEIALGSNLALRMSDGELKAAYTPPASSTGRETLSARVRVTYADELGTISKESQTSIVLYAPIRFVCTTAEKAPDPDQILSGIKAVRSSAAGDYTIPFESGEYVWLCFPAFMSPSSFTSGGFEVPVEDALTVACRIGQTNVNYRCIRVSGKPKTSPIKISVG